MRIQVSIFVMLLSVVKISGQSNDLVAIYAGLDETVSHLLFENGGDGFTKLNAFTARTYDLAEAHPKLTLSGDFTGDGLDETALFYDLLYTPNMNPEFTCSVVMVSRSNGQKFVPGGSWFSSLDTELNFDFVTFSVACDYNLDGMDDIALVYNDPASEQLDIYLLESTGAGFSAAQSWYSVDRSVFNFTALKFLVPGDFNGNGKPDIAAFYNYFGTSPETPQSIFLFESEGDSFTLLPASYTATKADLDFTDMSFALSGDFNQDAYSDIAVLMEDPTGENLNIPVFEGSATAQLDTVLYYTVSRDDYNISRIAYAAEGDFSGDSGSDLAMFYDNPATGSQEILVLESNSSSFAPPEVKYTTDPGSLSIANISALISGSFSQGSLVSAATWMDDMQGALSFTFDDGYRGAFEYGGAELEAAGFKGTYYIFSDTTTIYDGELASTSLVRHYREMGHEIASHTHNHSNLGFLSASGDTDSIEQVLSSSVELLNARFDQQTFSMSIPFGSFRYETLDHISQYFYTARSSQFGFNLATPYDFYALRSWPILSTTSPYYVDNLIATAESFGTYLPLMYHDMVDEPFDEEAEIYNYSRDLFRETVQLAGTREVWIDTHARVYKYIRERNALKISHMESSEMDSDPGYFSFEADDGLVDTIFDVALTLKISLPDSWTEDSVTVGPEGGYSYAGVQQNDAGNYILYNWLPVNGLSIRVHEGKVAGTGLRDNTTQVAKVSLVASPNPFHHETFISVYGSTDANAFLILRDLYGRVVKEIRGHTGSRYQISGDGLAPGVYFIQLIQGAQAVATLKVVHY